MQSDTTGCRFVAQRNDWETRFFQREIWTLTPHDRGGLTVLEHLEASPKVQLWECRVPVSANTILEALIASGFYLSDTACDFVFDLKRHDLASQLKLPEGISAHIGSTDDIPKLECLIRARGFRSRFERAPFSPSEGLNYYCTWASNAVLGKFDDACAVLARGEEILGFVTLRYIASGDMRIGLIATAANARRTGIGDALWSYAAHLAWQRGSPLLHMATQMTNQGAIALCTRMKGRLTGASVHLYLTRNVHS